jgi:TRAP-type transport system periplasmic protein
MFLQFVFGEHVVISIIIILQKRIFMKSYKKKCWIFLVIIIFFNVFFVDQGLSSEKPEFVFRMATMAPKDIGWARHMRKITRCALEKYTDNEIGFKWHWGGVLGDDKDYLKKMAENELDGAAVTGAGLSIAIPQMAVLTLPYMFNSYEEVDYIRQIMFDEFQKLGLKNNFKLICWADQGFDILFSTKWEFKQTGDFKKAKILSWFGPVEERFLTKLGARPVKYEPKEIMDTVKSKLADTFIVPAVWLIGSQLYTTVKYINIMNIRYAPAAIITTEKVWERYPRLTDKYGRALEEFRNTENIEFIKRTRLDSKKAYQAMLRYGIKENKFSAAETVKLKTVARSLWYELADVYYPQTLLDELLKNLDEFRNRAE